MITPSTVFAKPKRVRPNQYPIPHIPIKIHISRVKPDGIGLKEPAKLWRVDAIPVIVDADLSNPLAAGEQKPVLAQRRGERGVRGIIDADGTERVVLVAFDYGSGFVGQGDGAAQTIVVIINFSGGVLFPEDFVNLGTVDVLLHEVPGGIPFFEEGPTIVDEVNCGAVDRSADLTILIIVGHRHGVGAVLSGGEAVFTVVGKG
jgi:hypothetical protein